MNTPVAYEPTFPLRFRFRNQTFVCRPLDATCKAPMIRFARSLPESDLLFLDRDITQQSIVDRWVQDVAEGRLFTLVAWRDDDIVGYATFHRGIARWTHHVAELRVVVAEAARGFGLGRFLLELVFEMALQVGVTKVVARMTPGQTEAQNLFKRLGFEQEAVLEDNAMDTNGVSHDLLVFRFHARRHPQERCASCGSPVLAAISLNGASLCSHCYELQYEELGGGG